MNNKKFTLFILHHNEEIEFELEKISQVKVLLCKLFKEKKEIKKSLEIRIEYNNIKYPYKENDIRNYNNKEYFIISLYEDIEYICNKIEIPIYDNGDIKVFAYNNKPLGGLNDIIISTDNYKDLYDILELLQSVYNHIQVLYEKACTINKYLDSNNINKIKTVLENHYKEEIENDKITIRGFIRS